MSSSSAAGAPPPTAAELEVLKRAFGHSMFRGEQLAAIRAVLAGRDVLYVAATGSGKSLVYQMPTQLLRHGRKAGQRSTTLVVSPLVSLMEDQARHMRAAGISVAALHGETVGGPALWEAALRGDFDVVYTTPESALLRVPGLAAMHSRGTLDLLAIDEAHTVSEWGHDFRPDFRRLASLRDAMPGLPVLALTATATPRVRADIAAQLKLAAPLTCLSTFNRPNLHYTVRMKGGGGATGRAAMEADLRAVLADGAASTRVARPGSTIVYCATIKDTEEVAQMINAMALRLPAQPPAGASVVAAAAAEVAASGGAGGRLLPFAAASSSSSSSSSSAAAVLRASAYHSKMDHALKTSVHTAFVRDQLQVVVATVAFGMGIDKADVRCVVNWGLCKTLETFYQQTGRAGRDGEPARCVLLWAPSDINQIANLLAGGGGGSSSSSSGGGSGGASSTDSGANEGFEHMRRFVADTDGCRRVALLRYFGEVVPAGGPAFLPAQGCCDNCEGRQRSAAALTAAAAAASDGSAAAQPPPGQSLDAYDFSPDARLLLSAFAFCGDKVGQGKPISLLRGSRAKDVLDAYGGLQRLLEQPWYNKGAGKPERYWGGLLRLVMNLGLIQAAINSAAGRSGGGGGGGGGRAMGWTSYPLTPKGRSFLGNAGSTLPLQRVPDDMREYVAPQPRRHAGGASSGSGSSSGGLFSSTGGGYGAVPGVADLCGGEETLLTALKVWRDGQATEEGLAPFSVAPESLLRALARARPADAAALRGLEGMSDAKVARYGAKLLRIVAFVAAQVGLELAGAAAASAAASAPHQLPSAGDAEGARPALPVVPSRHQLELAAGGAGGAAAASPPAPPAPRAPPVDLVAACIAGNLSDAKREAWQRVVLQGSISADAFAAARQPKPIQASTVRGYLTECIEKGLLSTLIRGVTVRAPSSNGLAASAPAVTLTPGVSACLPRLADYDALAHHVLVARCGVPHGVVAALGAALRAYAREAHGGAVLHWTPGGGGAAAAAAGAAAASSPPAAPVPLERQLAQAADDRELLEAPTPAERAGGPTGFGSGSGLMSQVMARVVGSEQHKDFNALRLLVALVKVRQMHLLELAAVAPGGGGGGGGGGSSNGVVTAAAAASAFASASSAAPTPPPQHRTPAAVAAASSPAPVVPASLARAEARTPAVAAVGATVATAPAVAPRAAAAAVGAVSGGDFFDDAAFDMLDDEALLLQSGAPAAAPVAAARVEAPAAAAASGHKRSVTHNDNDAAGRAAAISGVAAGAPATGGPPPAKRQQLEARGQQQQQAAAASAAGVGPAEDAHAAAGFLNSLDIGEGFDF